MIDSSKRETTQPVTVDANRVPFTGYTVPIFVYTDKPTKSFKIRNTVYSTGPNGFVRDYRQ